MNQATLEAFVTQALDKLPPMPCRVDEMTAREYALYGALMPAVAALQTLATWLESPTQEDNA